MNALTALVKVYGHILGQQKYDVIEGNGKVCLLGLWQSFTLLSDTVNSL